MNRVSTEALTTGRMIPARTTCQPAEVFTQTQTKGDFSPFGISRSYPFVLLPPPPPKNFKLFNIIKVIPMTRRVDYIIYLRFIYFLFGVNQSINQSINQSMF